MEAKESLFLRILINRFHRTLPAALLKPLLNESVKQVVGCATSFDQIEAAIASPFAFMLRIHYSWFVPILEKMPPTMIPLVLSVLPESCVGPLKGVFNVPFDSFPHSKEVESFLQAQLYERIAENKPLPLEFLSETPLTPLLSWNKEQLVELIDFLGLYDLTEEIRHIIDKNTLKNINVALSPSKRQFLHLCLHQKKKISSSPLELNKWNGDKFKLEVLLHRRGMLRLGKAFYGQHPDFIWYIAHLFDKGRGNLLIKYADQPVAPAIVDVLLEQVVNVMNFSARRSSQK